MNILMTSFTRSHGMPHVPKFSCAMYAPQGYDYPRISWTLIGREDGSDWIRPRNFIGLADPLTAYKAALWARYDEREKVARIWCDMMAGNAAIAFCCWCPHDRAAQRQMGEHGSYICHTDVLGQWIEERLGVRVWYDDERRLMKHIP